MHEVVFLRQYLYWQLASGLVSFPDSMEECSFISVTVGLDLSA